LEIFGYIKAQSRYLAAIDERAYESSEHGRSDIVGMTFEG
jgi:hypothetical protein